MNRYSKILLLLLSFIFTLDIAKAQNGTYQALHANVAPVIDGDSNDLVWKASSTWYTYNQVWLNNAGSTPSAQDFSWKFKLAWDADRFYILAVVTDDVISDRYSDPLDRYWEDDCLEVFFDEDNSGGPHQSSFQAFAYHISVKYDIVDSDNTGAARLLNSHATVRMDTVNGKYIWECAFKVYNNSYTISNPGQPVTLFAGKSMGWALSYCDNDGGAVRDHFFGSEVVSGTNKNIAYQTADVFGTVELINSSVPTAINEPLPSESLKVYPNPFSEYITIDAQESGTVTLLDVQGRTVLKPTPVKAGENKFKLNLGSGNYQLIYEHGEKRERFVKLIERITD